MPIEKNTPDQKMYTRFKGYDNEEERTRTFVAKCKKSNEGRRRDRLTHAGPLSPSATTRNRLSIENKIFQYRDLIMPLLNARCDTKICSEFDKRSMSMIDALRENTLVALFSDLLKLAQFCDEYGHSVFPLEEYVFDHFLSEMMAAGFKSSSIDRHIASIAKWHKNLDLPDPRAPFSIQMRIKQIREKTKTPPIQKKGLKYEHLSKAFEIFDPQVPRDLADITLLFFAFDTLCRRSELSIASWEHLEFDPDGSGIYNLPSSKTDKKNEGYPLFLQPITMGLLEMWSQFTGKRGKIFRGIYSNGTMADSLSAKGVERSFKRIAERLGYDPSLFAGHSTRVGAAQEMAERNITETKIMLSGRWKSISTLLRYTSKIQAKKSGAAELGKVLKQEYGHLQLPSPRLNQQHFPEPLSSCHSQNTNDGC